MGEKLSVSSKKRPFLGLQHNGRTSVLISISGPKRADGRETVRFFYKNGLFLVYSTIAELRCTFDKFGPPKGQMGEKRSVSFQSIFEPCRQEPCYFRKQDMTMAGSSHDPERSKTMKGPFGPDRPPTQNLNFRLRQLSEAI